MGERQNHKGKALMGHGMGDVWLLASTGAPAAAPVEGTNHQELPSRTEVLQEPTFCISGHQPLHLGTQAALGDLRDLLWPGRAKGIRSCF